MKTINHRKLNGRISGRLEGLFATFGSAAWVITAAFISPLQGAEQPAVLLWEGGAPGALGDREQDKPTLTPFLAEKATSPAAAIVVCPGGGYGGLAPHEGKDYALWLNQQGIHAFVLKYRLGSKGYRHPRMLQDVSRAVRLVRARAGSGDWPVDAQRVGVMGSSAGGHLVSTILTHFDDGNPAADDAVDRQSSRPDLGILCYPVISMGPFTHGGSKRNLLGEKPDPALAWSVSSELQVTPRTPPCFIWHTYEDSGVPVENSLEFAAALRRAGVPFDLHVFQKGRHGLGLADKPPFENPHPWAADCAFWLKVQEFVK